ncbi:NAD(P)-binding protein [Conidiobolus coronatus NRRL 28638]|uniref:NAD(P)-binding protein n=1 Tax=Conidiobolus coronatus (strain ATCC 28846 / CBS 209.66 / NRRL 28638) TaxID=796925 RepID=A0A137NT92_CONC2|nr:NAD(P)-binding protein [Conidiobolus coronatus NRRL 28638]|eukprot:KXN65960.1 NAD(P)-binding protein [Conidiobolus coronatus NRRL 28638]
MLIKGTCSIVTGGASGIGKALTNLLVQKGGKVIVGDINEEIGRKEVDKLNKTGKNAVFTKCNVTKLEDLKNLFNVSKSEFGGAQILFNNAGRAEHKNTYESAENATEILNILLTSVIQGSVLANLHFSEQLAKNPSKQFCIINTSSIVSEEGLPDLPIYTLAKRSVKDWTQLNPYLNWKNTRINAIAPGYTQTNILISEEGEDKSHIFKTLYGSLLTPEYMATKMIELVEDDSLNGVVRYVNPTECHDAEPIGR